MSLKWSLVVYYVSDTLDTCATLVYGHQEKYQIIDRFFISPVDQPRNSIDRCCSNTWIILYVFLNYGSASWCHRWYKDALAGVCCFL